MFVCCFSLCLSFNLVWCSCSVCWCLSFVLVLCSCFRSCLCSVGVCVLLVFV